MNGLILKDRYQVEGFLDEGQQGQVYIVRDLQSPDQRHLAAKFSEDKEDLAKEIRYMKKVYSVFNKERD